MGPEEWTDCMMNNSQVDVSIIVPVYNHEQYIAKALDSILIQKTKYTYEILIGEDCSHDKSKEIIKEYEKKYFDKIRVFCRKINIGGTKNGYLLYMEARGRYIALLEGDDYWCDENKIERQVDFLDSHPAYIGVAHNFKKIDQNDDVVKEKCISKNNTECDFTWQDFLEKMFLFQSATLVYRNIFLENQDYSIIYKAHDIVWDMTVLTILLNRGKIYILSEVMSVYREIINNTASNARSIAYRDQGLSTLKTVRQYDLLRPYLNHRSDFDRNIAEMKADFIIQMIKNRKGYTFIRWIRLSKYGNKKTNVKAIGIALKVIRRKLFNIVRKYINC